MNLLKDISFFCHYKLEKEEKIKKIKDGKIIALSEGMGYIKDDRVIIIGQEPVYLF